MSEGSPSLSLHLKILSSLAEWTAAFHEMTSSVSSLPMPAVCVWSVPSVPSPA